jgi:hypothetical protein
VTFHYRRNSAGRVVHAGSAYRRLVVGWVGPGGRRNQTDRRVKLSCHTAWVAWAKGRSIGLLKGAVQPYLTRLHLIKRRDTIKHPHNKTYKSCLSVLRIIKCSRIQYLYCCLVDCKRNLEWIDHLIYEPKFGSLFKRLLKPSRLDVDACGHAISSST